MQQDHLQVVNDGGADGSGTPPKKKRAASRLRTTRSLPTDRLKFPTQTELLRAYVVVSQRGAKPVGANDLGASMKLSAATTPLMNGFFLDAGLIERQGKGRYVPTSAAIQYHQLHSADLSTAGQSLAGPLRKSWYFNTVVQQLDLDGSEARVIAALAHAAGAAVDVRRDQLRAVLHWLAYAGLIVIDGDVVRLRDDAPDRQQKPPAPNEKQVEPGGRAASEGTTKTNRGESPQVVGFSFDLALNSDQLSELSADQITALFKALGEIMAIKAGLNN